MFVPFGHKCRSGATEDLPPSVGSRLREGVSDGDFDLAVFTLGELRGVIRDEVALERLASFAQERPKID